jgi:NADPH:quinone reductase-like Zn-dependent oxidoreductase
MKAVVQDRYGPPDLLTVRDIAAPTIGQGDVLVQVIAAGLHVGDCFGVRGTPFPVRFMTGLVRPKPGVPGFDLAGRVVSVGSRVTRFRPGDAVFGVGHGTCAELAMAAEAQLQLKPSSLTFEQAAAIPTSALAALHGLRDAGRVRPGQRVLINGASGGVGTFAVQIAKALEAEVTGVCSAANVALVQSLGADHVIDYTRQDYTRTGPYDLVLDNIENRSLRECRRALTPSGTLVLNSGTGRRGLRFLARLVGPVMLSPFVRHRIRRYLSMPNHEDLAILAAWVESGALTPVIDRTFQLHETAGALRYIEVGHARGKVVIAVDPARVVPCGE